MNDEIDIVGSYFYGSNDSSDIDCFVAVSRIPSSEDLQYLKEFRTGIIEGVRRSTARLKGCSVTDVSNVDVDLSFIHINEEQGVIDWCEYDNLAEANNCLYHTFDHHRYNTRSYHSNPVKKTLTQNVSLKLVKNIRTLLTCLSRTQHRDVVKHLLKEGTFFERIEFVSDLINSNLLQEIKTFNKNLSDVEIAKDLAFSFIQLHALIQGFEVFTKRDACLNYPDLAKYIFRQKSDLEALESFLYEILEELSTKVMIHPNVDAVRYVQDKYGCLNKQETLIEIVEE